MGLEDAPTRGVSVPNQPLVTSAAPVVEPSATSALVDSFRKGLITSQDIVERLGATGKAKKKAEQVQAEEFVSPEAVAARKQALAAATARGQLEASQATAAEPLVGPQSKLAQSQIELQQASSEYGPGVQYFATLAPEMGVKEWPKTPEGKPDYAKWASIGIQLYEAKKAQELAKNRLQVAHWQTSADGTTLLKFNKDGELLTPDVEDQLRKQAVATPFTATPGQAQVAPEPVQVLPKDEPMAGMITTVGGSPTAPVVAPKIAGTATATGISLGPPSWKEKENKPVPAEGVEKLALATQARETANRLSDAYNKLVASNPEFTGVLKGNLAKIAQTKRWNEQVAAFEREATAILAPVAKGTYNETGVLSDSDVERYKSVIPDLRDQPKVGNEKIRRLLNEVNQSYANKLSIWKQAGYDVSGFENPAGTGATSAPAAPAATSPRGEGWGPVVDVPGAGRVQRGPDGKYYRAQ